MNWLYHKTITTEDIESFYGFIYEIEYENGMKYVGKKTMWSETKKHLGKKELAKITDKRLKTYTIVRKESNWKKYNGSCKQAIDSPIAKKRILRFCETKLDLTYWEESFLMARDVLFNDKYYNSNIAGKYYAGKLTGSKEYIK